MIKVTLKNNATPTPKKNPYPCLMLGTGGSIVLMTSAIDDPMGGTMGVGVLLRVTDGVGTNQLYKSTGKWPLSEFTLYKGKFIIENM